MRKTEVSSRNLNRSLICLLIAYYSFCGFLAAGCGRPKSPPVVPDEYAAYLELIQANKYEQAIPGLQTELEIKPDDWRAYHYLGICYQKLGRRYRAIEYFNQAVSLADNYRPYYRLGILYIETGESDQALVLLRKVKRYKPDFLNGRFYLAVAAFYNNRIEESFENFRYILAKQENEPNSLAGIGLIKYYQGNPYQAVEFLLKSISYAPQWAWGRYQLGMIYFKLGKVEDAEQQFRLALKFDPHNPATKFQLGLTLEKARRAEEAGHLYEELLALEDDIESLNIIKASILMQRRDFEKARELLLANLRVTLQPFENYKRLGYIYAVSGNTERGLESYNEALRHNPDDIGVRYNYAVLLKKAGRDKEAEEEFKRILTVNPLTSEGYFIQGIIYGRQGDLEKAEELIKAAVELDRYNSQGREVLMNILINNDKLAEAAAIAEEILEVNPGNREVSSLLAQVFIRMKNYRQAENLLQGLINWAKPGVEDIENMRSLHTIYRETGRLLEAGRLRTRLQDLGLDILEPKEAVY